MSKVEDEETSKEDYDWDYEDGCRNPHDDEIQTGGPMCSFEHECDNIDERKVMAVLMHDPVIAGGDLKETVEDIDWDDEETRKWLVEGYNDWIDIHHRTPIAIFTSKEKYDAWRKTYLGEKDMPNEWHVALAIPVDNGPIHFGDKTPYLGDLTGVGTMDEIMETVMKHLKDDEEFKEENT